jgi:YVTN family beta-propeller protein
MMRKPFVLAAGVSSMGLLALGGFLLSQRAPPAPPSAPAAPPPVAAAPVKVEREGVSLAFDLTLSPRLREAAKGAPLQGVARITLTDARTGEPLAGRRPLAWMRLRQKGEAAPDDAACREQVKTYLGGLLSARADVDLNAYWFLTLNHDHTVSVINPQIAFDRTKLQHLVSVGGGVADWALLPDRSALYVTVPVSDTVSVVDMQRFVVTRPLQVGRQPGRVSLSPDGLTAWVSNDGDGTVSVIDTPAHEVRDPVEVGPGPHAFGFSDSGRTAWVSSRDATTLTALDVASGEVLGRVEAGAGVTELAWSDVARALFAARPDAREVLVVDPARREVSRRIPVKGGLDALRFDNTGRWAFAVHKDAGTVDILDAATGQVAHTLTGFSAPDSVVFTDAFAYVRNTTDSRVTLVELKTLEGQGTPSQVQVTMGQRPAVEARLLGRSDPIAPLPEGTGVIAAGNADRALFLYQEGMMAPRGTHLNYGREPRAVKVLDRSLREVEPGVFTARGSVRENGVYDVQVVLDNPRVITCLEWKVDEVPQDASLAKALKLQLTPQFDARRTFTQGQTVPLRFRLEPTAGTDQPPVAPEEIRVLLFRTPGTWQVRTEPRRVADGLFEVDFSPPTPGQYKFVVGVEGRGLDLGRLPTSTLGVVAPLAAAVSTETSP